MAPHPFQRRKRVPPPPPPPLPDPRPMAGPRQRLGAAQRLIRTSEPAPEVALGTKNLSKAKAPTRRGQFYEKSSSRQSRVKRALELHGEISRDISVPLGANREQRGIKKRKVFQEDMSTIEDRMAEQGQRRAVLLRHAITKQQQQPPKVQRNSSSSVGGKKQASKKAKAPPINKRPSQPAATNKKNPGRVKPPESQNEPPNVTAKHPPKPQKLPPSSRKGGTSRKDAIEID